MHDPTLATTNIEPIRIPYGRPGVKAGSLGRFARIGLSAAVLGMLGGCAWAGSAPASSHAELVVLVDLTPSGLAGQAGQRQHIEHYVVPLAVQQRATIQLATINDAALREPTIQGEFSFDTAEAEGNRLVSSELVAGARADLLAAVDRLLVAGSPAEASDVIGAVAWAAKTLAGSGPGWHGIVVLSDAVNTVVPCNMAVLPPSADGATISACFPAGVPSLVGDDLYFLGATAYAGVDQPPVDPVGLEQFWRTVVDQGRGKVQAFGPTVLGPPTATTED
jgi:hypothetical protein